MKDDPECMAMARVQQADAMTKFDSIKTPRSLHRTTVDCEHDCVTFP